MVRARVSAKQQQGAHRLGAALIVVVCLAAAAWVGAQALDTGVGALFRDNARYTIAYIDVEVTGPLDKEAVSTDCGARIGDNLFRTNLLETVRAQLMKKAQIRKATVGRRLPDTLVIEATAREPLARLPTSYPGVIFAVDAEGMVLPKKMASANLPMLTGLPSPQGPGSPLTDAPALDALKLLDTWQASTLRNHIRIQSVDAADPAMLVLHLEDGATARFGRENYSRKLSHLAEMIADVRHRGEEGGDYNLLVDRNEVYTPRVAATP